MRSTSSSSLPLFDLDPEIERTFHKRRCQARIARFEEELRQKILKEMEEENQNLEAQRAGLRPQHDPQMPVMRPVGASCSPTLAGLPSSIARQAVNANNFELKPGMIQMIQQNCQFHGFQTEDPSEHLALFNQLCDTVKINGVPDEIIRLKLFSFTLKDRAWAWLQAHPANYFSDWNDLAMKFLQKYFPPSKTIHLRNEIYNFRQYEGESVAEAWERFNEAMRKCPHHGIPGDQQIQIFYYSLSPDNAQFIDAAAGGVLMSRSLPDCTKLLNELSANSYRYPKERMVLKKPVSAVNEHSDQIAILATQQSQLTQQIATLVQKLNNTQVSPGQEEQTYEVGSEVKEVEQANFMGNFNRQQRWNQNPTHYYPGIRNHPNFSYANNQNVQNPMPTQQPQEKKKSIEEVLSQFMEQTQTILSNQSAAIKNLERHVGQLAASSSVRQPGTFPSDTVPNPKESVQVIITRGREKELQRKANEDPNMFDEDQGSNLQHSNQENSRETENRGLGFDSAELEKAPQQSYLRPQESVLSPQAKELSPQHAELRPQQGELNPRHQAVKPQHADLSPQANKLSPQHAELRPQETVLRPQQGELSPQQDELRPQRIMQQTEPKLFQDTNIPPYKPKIPYPQRLIKKNLDQQFSRFLEVFKKLHINIPLVEALTQMPSYAKFVKEILSRKRNLEEFDTVALTEECSAILQKKLPPKLKDP